MALYEYKAINPSGQVVTGVIAAESSQLAKESLRKEKLIVTRLVESGKQQKVKDMQSSTLIAFTRDMFQLLKAGLPVYESLLTIEEKLQNHPSKAIVAGIINQVKQGKALSIALSSYPKTFDAIYCSMVASAEKSGSLTKTFEEIFKLLVRQNKLKKQLISSLTYPIILAAFCLFVTLALFLFVIPSMKELFEGRELHPMTETVLSISDFLEKNGLLLLSIVISAITGIVIVSRTDYGKRLFYEFLHKVPLIKKILMHGAIVRFSRTLSLLLSSGVGLIESLALTERVTKHPLLEEIIEKGSKRVLQGEKLSAQFTSPLLPPLISRMTSIAESTGKMPEMLYSLADIYEEELERHLSQITTLLQPLLLLLLGAIIGTVVLSILLPLTDVGSFT